MATKKAQKQEFTMEQAFAMWRKTSKAGKPYFTGKTKDAYLVGFYNGKKQNPKEPDIRIYEQDKDGNTSKEEYVSLWCNVSKNGKKYLSGKIGEKRVVGFINEKADGNRPYFSVYYSEGDLKKEAPAGDDFVTVPEGADEEMPF